MRHHAYRWTILSVLFFHTLCHGTSIVWVVSETGEYVVLAADSRRFADVRDPKFKSPNPKFRNLESNNRECKVIALDDTLFFNSGSVVIGAYRGKSWDSMQTAREVYAESKDHAAQALSIAWGNRALEFFYRQNLSDLQSTANPEGALVNGGFINFDSNRQPAAFAQNLSFDAGTRQLSRKPTSQAKGQIGAAGIRPELVIEFEKAETPRALNAHGDLKIHNVAKKASYDIEFVKRAVQFVMDNVSEKEKQYVHGPIDVVIIRGFGGIDWVTRKPNCYSMDLRSGKKEKSAAHPKRG